MPFGIRARGRGKRTKYQQAAHENRLFNSTDPGVRAMEPARTKARIRGIRNVAKGQHTAQAEMIKERQDIRAEQERQNEFQRRRLAKQDARQAARDKENDYRFRLLHGNQLKTEAEKQAEQARLQSNLLLAGRNQAIARAHAQQPVRRRLAPTQGTPSRATRTTKPVELVRGELPKQPSKTQDYWISALEKFSPEAAKKLTAGFGLPPVDAATGQPDAIGKFGAGIELTDAIARNEQLRMRNTYLDALDEYSRRNPQGTEEDAVRFAAKAAGLKLPTRSEEAAGVRNLFAPEPDNRTTATPQRNLVPGTTPTLGPQTQVTPSGFGSQARTPVDLTKQSSGGGAPWPGGIEPAWYKARQAEKARQQADREEAALFGPKQTGLPGVVPGTTAFPSVAPTGTAPTAQTPTGNTTATPGSAGYADVVNAAGVGNSLTSLLKNAASHGTAATQRADPLQTLSNAQAKLRSGAVPQDQREPLQRMLQAVNNLMNKANRTAQEETALTQAIERLNALYGG